jgi:hypothetical protein
VKVQPDAKVVPTDELVYRSNCSLYHAINLLPTLVSTNCLTVLTQQKRFVGCGIFAINVLYVVVFEVIAAVNYAINPTLTLNLDVCQIHHLTLVL